MGRSNLSIGVAVVLLTLPSLALGQGGAVIDFETGTLEGVTAGSETELSLIAGASAIEGSYSALAQTPPNPGFIVIGFIMLVAPGAYDVSVDFTLILDHPPSGPATLTITANDVSGSKTMNLSDFVGPDPSGQFIAGPATAVAQSVPAPDGSISGGITLEVAVGDETMQMVFDRIEAEPLLVVVDPGVVLADFEAFVTSELQAAEAGYANILTEAIALIDGAQFVSETQAIMDEKVGEVDALRQQVDAAINNGYAGLVANNAAWLAANPGATPKEAKNNEKRANKSTKKAGKLRDHAIKKNEKLAADVVEEIVKHGQDAQEQQLQWVMYGQEEVGIICFMKEADENHVTIRYVGGVREVDAPPPPGGAFPPVGGVSVTVYDGFRNDGLDAPNGVVYAYWKVIVVDSCPPTFRQYVRRFGTATYCEGAAGPDPDIPTGTGPNGPYQTDCPPPPEGVPPLPPTDCVDPQDPNAPAGFTPCPSLTGSCTTLVLPQSGADPGTPPPDPPDPTNDGAAADGPGATNPWDMPEGADTSTPPDDQNDPNTSADGTPLFLETLDLQFDFITCVYCGETQLGCVRWGFHIQISMPCPPAARNAGSTTVTITPNAGQPTWTPTP